MFDDNLMIKPGFGCYINIFIYIYIGVGNLRTFKVLLDTAQYQLDMNNIVENDAVDVYTTFNLLMRRKPKENNFKAVLGTIRDIMSVDIAVPSWLHDVFLGNNNNPNSPNNLLSSYV